MMGYFLARLTACPIQHFRMARHFFRRRDVEILCGAQDDGAYFIPCLRGETWGTQDWF